MITLDLREPLPYRKAVAKALDLPTTEVMMETGDYSWDSPFGLVVVERKTVSDLIHSVKDGRWATQIRRLSEIERPFVLIEGTVAYHTGEPIRAAAIDYPGWGIDRWNSLLATAQEVGVRLSFASAGKSGVAESIRGLYMYSQKEVHESLEIKKPKVALPAEGYALALLTALPGLGTVTARKLLMHYGQPYDFFAALLDAKIGDDSERLPDWIVPSKIKQWQDALFYEYKGG